MNRTPTNCIGECQLHPTFNYCTGCLRTIEQIENWSKYTAAEKKEILKTDVNKTFVKKIKINDDINYQDYIKNNTQTKFTKTKVINYDI